MTTGANPHIYCPHCYKKELHFVSSLSVNNEPTIYQYRCYNCWRLFEFVKDEPLKMSDFIVQTKETKET